MKNALVFALAVALALGAAALVPSATAAPVRLTAPEAALSTLGTCTIRCRIPGTLTFTTVSFSTTAAVCCSGTTQACPPGYVQIGGPVFNGFKCLI